MPKRLQERKREHAVFVAQGGSKCMFRGSENMEKSQNIEKKHVQRQRRHAEARVLHVFQIFCDFWVVLGRPGGLSLSVLGEQKLDAILRWILETC